MSDTSRQVTYEDCGACDGTGHGAAGDEYPCGSCDGTGTVRNESPLPAPLGLDPAWQQGAAEEWGTNIPALKHDPLAALNAIDALTDRLDTAERERDELRAELARIRPVFDAALDHIAEGGMNGGKYSLLYVAYQEAVNGKH